MVALVLAMLLWVAEVAIAVDTLLLSPVYGIPGLVVAVGGLSAIKWWGKSWATALVWSALLSFVLMFGLLVATFRVY